MYPCLSVNRVSRSDWRQVESTQWKSHTWLNRIFWLVWIVVGCVHLLECEAQSAIVKDDTNTQKRMLDGAQYIYLLLVDSTTVLDLERCCIIVGLVCLSQIWLWLVLLYLLYCLYQLVCWIVYFLVHRVHSDLAILIIVLVFERKIEIVVNLLHSILSNSGLVFLSDFSDSSCGGLSCYT